MRKPRATPWVGGGGTPDALVPTIGHTPRTQGSATYLRPRATPRLRPRATPRLRPRAAPLRGSALGFLISPLRGFLVATPSVRVRGADLGLRYAGWLFFHVVPTVDSNMLGRMSDVTRLIDTPRHSPRKSATISSSTTG